MCTEIIFLFSVCFVVLARHNCNENDETLNDYFICKNDLKSNSRLKYDTILIYFGAYSDDYYRHWNLMLS